MKGRLTALFLAAALTLGLCGASVLAQGESPAAGVVQSEATAVSDSGTSGTAQAKRDSTDPVPDTAVSEATEVSDAEGTLSFASLEKRVKENNFTARALGENIAMLDEIDYTKLENDLRDMLNQLADFQWATIMMSPPAMASAATQNTQAQYDAMRKQFDDIKNGKLQKDNAGVKRQLESAQDQMVMAAQSLYITLIGLQRSEAALDRSSNALTRTVKEMELRYEMGQISKLQLEQVKLGQTQLISGQKTMQMNIGLLRMQLNALIGEEPDAVLTLQPLGTVSAQQLEAMALEADYEKAFTASYETYAAQKTLDDAKEDYKDAMDKYGTYSKRMEATQAKHTWQAAQYTYDAAVQSFEMKFRTLHAQVQDYAQILDAARVALSCEESEFAAQQLKYEQGAISQNAFLSAQDDLAAAHDSVSSAASDLFSAYTNYVWAVEHGILN